MSRKPLNKPTKAEALIKFNGDLVESLLSHDGWSIVQDLIDEGVASVVGRKTNGIYYYGDLVRVSKNKEYLTGYYEALSQLNNRVLDFIKARNQLIEQKKQEEINNKQPLVNPFLEELNEEAQYQ